jgi:hypothetical protein
MNLGIYTRIMAPEPISTAYFIHPSHQSVCLYVYAPYRQRLGSHVPVAKNTRNNGRIVGGVVFYAASVLSKESRRLVLPGNSCLFSGSVLHAFLVSPVRGLCTAHFILHCSLHRNNFRLRVQTVTFLIMYANVLHFSIVLIPMSFVACAL